MNKISLWLLSWSLPIIPIVTMVSCSTVPVVDLKISITKNPVTQLDINKAVVDYNQATNTEMKVEILNRLFSGVTLDNFVNFTTETTIDSITLTALPGFLFGTKGTIKARIVTVDPMMKC